VRSCGAKVVSGFAALGREQIGRDAHRVRQDVGGDHREDDGLRKRMEQEAGNAAERRERHEHDADAEESARRPRRALARSARGLFAARCSSDRPSCGPWAAGLGSTKLRKRLLLIFQFDRQNPRIECLLGASPTKADFID